MSNEMLNERNGSVADSSVRTTGQAAPALLAATDVTKSFGPTKALAGASVSVGAGQIVALMGENGSGKSTLVKMLSGVLRPDGGAITVDGRPVSLARPKDALRAGIATVFQEILVAPDLTVAENVALGPGLPPLRGRRAGELRAQTAALLAALCPDPPGLDVPVRRLDLMRQQVCVLARGLLRRPRLLILDEATSTLDVTIRDRLFGELRRRCAAGAGVLFISHRMDEVLTLADRFVALRSGATVGVLEHAEVSAQRLVSLISGAGAGATRAPRQRIAGTGTCAAPAGAPAAPAAPAAAITVRDLRVLPGAAPVSATIGRGEIVGLAGLEGQGQDEFLRVLAGLRAPASGEVLLPAGAAGAANSAGSAGSAGSADGTVTIRSYRQAVRRGVAYVPRDRKSEGIADVLSSLDNFGVPTMRADTTAGILRYSRTLARYRAAGGTVNLSASARTPAGRLSGGNQQKVVLARWLATRPSVLLLNDPTRGVDLRTKHELYDLFERLTDDGLTIVMLSTELEEHLSLMDRVLVFHAGSCVSELSRATVSRDRLVAAYFGHQTPARAGREAGS
jgi:ABC-type sugar transport system ATPase subunit